MLLLIEYVIAYYTIKKPIERVKRASKFGQNLDKLDFITGAVFKRTRSFSYERELSHR